jgi:hypothetical protein
MDDDAARRTARTEPCWPCIPPRRIGLDAPIRRRDENLGKSNGPSPLVTLGVSLTG